MFQLTAIILLHYSNAVWVCEKLNNMTIWRLAENMCAHFDWKTPYGSTSCVKSYFFLPHKTLHKLGRLNKMRSTV
jgi:hypothetical protein